MVDITGRHQLVIDCDPGIDDAFALALAAASPDVELRAVTTVAGNVPLDQTTTNALALLHAFGRDDVPVAAGCARGLVRVKPAHPAVHGSNGLGGFVLAQPDRVRVDRHAVAELAGVLADSEPGVVTIVAIGPLTNIATLIALHPELVKRIDRLVIMGGSAGPGNVTPRAEYNCWADPEAAAKVLSAGLRICVAQLQATRHATLDDAARKALASHSETGAALIAMLEGYAEGPDVNPALHDVVALAAVIDPTLVLTRPARVRVVTDPGPARGETVVEFGDTGGESRDTEVVVDVDVDRLRRLLVERLAGDRAAPRESSNKHRLGTARRPPPI